MPVNPAAWELLSFSNADIKEILSEAEDSFQMTEDMSL
jgi:hypothetical protein